MLDHDRGYSGYSSLEPSYGGGGYERDRLIDRDRRDMAYRNDAYPPIENDRVRSIRRSDDGSVDKWATGKVSLISKTPEGDLMTIKWDNGEQTKIKLSQWDTWVEKVRGGRNAFRRLYKGDRVSCIKEYTRGNMTIREGTYGVVYQTVYVPEQGEYAYEFRWEDPLDALSQCPYRKWDEWVRKIDPHRWELEEAMKGVWKVSTGLSVLLQVFVLVLMYIYFGRHEDSKMATWLLLPGISLLPWLAAVACSFNRDCKQKKRSTIPGLLMLVLVCMVAGGLTLTHCFLFPNMAPLHPLAQVPEFENTTFTKASTNALICWAESKSLVSQGNKFLAHSGASSVPGVHAKSLQWGIAFSSVMSPLVPMALGAVYYFMIIRSFEVFWFAPSRSKTVACDIVDCIVMYDTIFSHDPYFAFEDTQLGGIYVWGFVVVLGVWWIIATCQLWFEFHDDSYFDAMDAHAQPQDKEKPRHFVLYDSFISKLLSAGLNLSFLFVRLCLRFKAQYCSPVFMVKNCVIWWYMHLKRESKNGKDEEGALQHMVEMEGKCDHMRELLTEIKYTAAEKLMEVRRGGGHGMHGSYGGRGGSFRELVSESRRKIDDALRRLKDERVSQALNYANDSRDLETRRGSVGEEGKKDMKIQFKSYMQGIETEVNNIQDRVKMVFEKLERDSGGGGHEAGSHHNQSDTERLMSALDFIQATIDKRDDEHKLGIDHGTNMPGGQPGGGGGMGGVSSTGKRVSTAIWNS